MIIGIDVGGTFTDGVLLKGEEVIAKIKIPTDAENLLNSLLEALGQLVIKTSSKAEIKRIVLSTTLITNLIATKQVKPVALLLIPGPGMNPFLYDFKAAAAYILKGAIDYRGREIEPLDREEIAGHLESISKKGLRHVAVVGKFSQRNNKHEQEVASYFRGKTDFQVLMGHQVSSRLNFPRRIATTLLTLATQEAYQYFFSQVKQALAELEIEAPIYILKADGGTLPFSQSLKKPVETIFSGPAASTLGALALTPADQTSVVVDIGGTTTDLALLLSGRPLLASRGAGIDDYLTHVRAFATKSVALGGDSIIEVRNGEMQILPQREGPAYCLGGPRPTPTDAMRVAGYTGIGDLARARKAMELLAEKRGIIPEKTAFHVMNLMLEKIIKEIHEMFITWEKEPAYRIWELLQEKKVKPQNIIGIGAAAPAVINLIGEKMGCMSMAPTHAEVANAIGAALAKVTLGLTFHYDTERKFYFIEESGRQDSLPQNLVSLKQAEDLSFSILREESCKLGIPSDEKPELVYSEVFNMVRGWSTVGKLFDVGVQFPPGVRIKIPREVI